MPNPVNSVAILLLLTATALVGQTAPPAPEKPSSIEGAVLNAVTGEPLARAHIMLRSFSNQGQRNYGALSGPDGKFSVTGMASGTYTLGAERVGFVAAQPRNQQITLSAGDAKTEVKVKLTPCGAITGRVLNPEGEPLESVDVSAIQNGHFSGPAAKTDENGDFRIGGLTPGKYRLRAKPMPAPLPPDIRSDGTVEVHYQRTYYPNVPNEAAGARVEVAAGAETPGADIHLLRGPLVRVSGVVTGLPPDSEHVAVTIEENGTWSGGPNLKEDGKFQIWRLDPGKYTLTARKFVGQTQVQSGPVEIEVGEANIDHVELRIVPAADIQGRIEYDDEQAKPPPPQQGTPAPVRQLFLQGHEGGRPAKIGDDGSFNLEKVQPDIYHVRLSWRGTFVKSMLLGQTQVDGSTLDLRNGAAGQTLSVRLSSAVAKVSGIVRRGNDPAAGVRVMLVEVGGGQFGFTQTTEADASGAYGFPNIPPGKFKVVATEATDNMPGWQGRLPEELEALAETIDVGPGDQLTRDLKAQ